MNFAPHPKIANEGGLLIRISKRIRRILDESVKASTLVEVVMGLREELT